MVRLNLDKLIFVEDERRRSQYYLLSLRRDSSLLLDRLTKEDIIFAKRKLYLYKNFNFFVDLDRDGQDVVGRVLSMLSPFRNQLNPIHFSSPHSLYWLFRSALVEVLKW